MAGNRPVRNATGPRAGVVIAVAFGGCLAWLAWMESCDRGWIPGIPPRPKEAVNENVPSEPLELPGVKDVPALIAILSDGASDERRQALLQLSSIGPAAQQALPAIRGQMQDENPGVRFAVVIALGRICQDPDVVIPLVAAMLDDESSLVAEAAARMLEQSGPRAVETTMNVLGGDSPARARAVLVLRRLMRPDNFSEISTLIRGLRDDSDPRVRAEALMFCLETGVNDSATIRALLETEYTSPAVHPARYPEPFGSAGDRNTCNMALMRLGPDSGEFVPELITLFETQAELDPAFSNSRPPRQARQPAAQIRPTVRMGLILGILSALKTEARPAIPHLLARLEGLEPPHSLKLIGILSDIGADPEVLTPPLTELLKHRDPRSGRAAAGLLARVNPPEACRQVALVVASLAAGDQSKVLAARPLLAGFGPEARAAVPLLIEQLSNEGKDYRYWALEALGAIGPDAAPAVPAIIGSLQQTQREGKILYYGDERLETLAKIGPAAKDAAPLLLELMNDPRLAPPPGRAGSSSEMRFRELVMSALARIAPESPEVDAAIRAQLRSDFPQLREAALFELARPSRDPPLPLEELITIFQTDEEMSVRTAAAMLVAEMPGDRSSALAPLIEALDDDHPDVRKAAAMALGSMNVAAKCAIPKLREIWVDEFCGVAPSLPRSGALVTANAAMRFGEARQLQRLSMAAVLLRAMMDIDPGTLVTP